MSDPLAIDAAQLMLLMKLNFEANAMRGCWLAMDDQDRLRLCTQLDPRRIDEHEFTSLMIGFITLGKDVRTTLEGLLR